jgi:glycosyltransferase involved in cell wall biosynthesis
MTSIEPPPPAASGSRFVISASVRAQAQAAGVRIGPPTPDPSAAGVNVVPMGRAPWADIEPGPPTPDADISPTRRWRHSPDETRAFTPSDIHRCPRPRVSVVILTYQEEINLRACLESCAWCDDVHVLDSGSTDRTHEIARTLGAAVHVNAFRSFGQQRSWGIESIPAKHRWHFQLDADERFTPAGVREMSRLIDSRTEADNDGDALPSAYRCPSMLMFHNRWLKHAAEYPVHQVRLFDAHRTRFGDYGHGQREIVAGSIGTMAKPYQHWNFSKGLDEWFEKHNRYARLEAEQALADMEAGGFGVASALRDVLWGGRIARRAALKRLSYRTPSRPTLLTLYAMIVQLGFLDGRTGLSYTRLRAIYQSMITAKMDEIRGARSASGGTPR